MNRFLNFVFVTVFGGILRFLGREVFLPGFRWLVRWPYFWGFLILSGIGISANRPQVLAGIDQAFTPAFRGIDAVLPMVVIGGLLFWGLSMITGIRPRGRRDRGNRGGRGGH